MADSLSKQVDKKWFILSQTLLCKKGLYSCWFIRFEYRAIKNVEKFNEKMFYRKLPEVIWTFIQYTVYTIHWILYTLEYSNVHVYIACLVNNIFGYIIATQR